MKLTPLNITLACVLVWFLSEINHKDDQLISWGWMIVFVVLLAALDLGFRLIFRDVKRLWIMQIAFILVVSILLVLIKMI